jgi:hypothetical protein
MEILDKEEVQYATSIALYGERGAGLVSWFC